MFSLRGGALFFHWLNKKGFFQLNYFRHYKYFREVLLILFYWLFFAGPFQTFNAISGIVHKELQRKFELLSYISVACLSWIIHEYFGKRLAIWGIVVIRSSVTTTMFNANKQMYENIVTCHNSHKSLSFYGRHIYCSYSSNGVSRAI